MTNCISAFSISVQTITDCSQTRKRMWLHLLNKHNHHQFFFKSRRRLQLWNKYGYNWRINEQQGGSNHWLWRKNCKCHLIL